MAIPGAANPPLAIAYVATDENGLTSTSTRTVLIEATPSIVPTDDTSSTTTSTP